MEEFMNPFDFVREQQIPAAVKSGSREGAKFIAGGSHIVDINALPLGRIEPETGGVRIGAMVRMSDLALHPHIIQNYPAISQALLLSASPQIRNMASIGGN